MLFGMKCEDTYLFEEALGTVVEGDTVEKEQ
jgi:hypothetical protein